MAKVTYINIKNTNKEVETIDEVRRDEYETYKEYKQELDLIISETIKSYRKSGYEIYTSNRCTKDWANRK